MPKANDPVSMSVWLRPQRARTGQPGLSRDQIVRAALELLDADGIAGLSMRRLGTRRGSGATSLYWYVNTKDELLDFCFVVCFGVVFVLDGEDWRESLRTAAHALRDMVLRHPWITSVFGYRPAIGPKSMGLSDKVIGVLMEAGFTGVHVAYASNLLTSYAIGQATVEAAWQLSSRRSGTTEQELRDAVTANAARFMSGHPNYERWWQSIDTADVSHSRGPSFDYGLDRILDGLESWLAT